MTVVLTLLLLVPGSLPDDASDVRAVEAVVAAIIEADNAGDLEAVTSLYSEDAMLLPPDAAAIEGRAAIHAHYRGLFSRFSLRVRIDSEETVVSGWLAFNRGSTKVQSTSKETGELSRAEDKYVMVLKRVGEDWRISRLIWNRQPQEP